MQTQHGHEAIEALITQYAAALNTADAATLSGFFTPDGEFMPEGLNTISAAGISKLGNSYLNKHSFSISYTITNIAVDERHAFVEAIATTSIASPSGALRKTSRDFFVLQAFNGEWKIIRYIFNNVTPI